MRMIKNDKIAELNEYFEVSYECLDDDALHERYDEMLNDCHECTCSSCNNHAEHLKEDDPIMYRCGFSDWLDAELRNEALFEIGGEYFTEEQVDEYKDELVSAVEELF